MSLFYSLLCVLREIFFFKLRKSIFKIITGISLASELNKYVQRNQTVYIDYVIG